MSAKKEKRLLLVFVLNNQIRSEALKSCSGNDTITRPAPTTVTRTNVRLELRKILWGNWHVMYCASFVRVTFMVLFV